MTADYDDRMRAVGDATRLLRDMTTPPPPRTQSTGTFTTTSTYFAGKPLDRFEVVELARFLLGLDNEPAKGGAA
jgi:hypothetical protein